MYMIPEKGFYYHVKHDSAKGITDAAYELVGAAWNTEAVNFHSDNPADFIATEVAVYRPLFSESMAYKNGQRFWIRPYIMFMELVEKDGQMVPRFQKITDPTVIAELVAIRDRMYSDSNFP